MDLNIGTVSIIQPGNEAETGWVVSIATPPASEVSAAESGCLNRPPFGRDD